MENIDDKIEKILERAVLAEYYRKINQDLGDKLINSDILNDFKTEVNVIENIHDSDKFDVHITNTIVPKQCVKNINITIGKSSEFE